VPALVDHDAVPSRLGPRVVLLRALGMAFILTRTTAPAFPPLLFEIRLVCWDFWREVLPLVLSNRAPSTKMKAVKAERMLLAVIVMLPEVAYQLSY